MGEEISNIRFRKSHFRDFQERLQQETALLQRWFETEAFDGGQQTGGFEIESWLVDRVYNPAPINQAFLELLQNPMVVPELSAFNVELNNEPQFMTGRALSRMHEDLDKTWRNCRDVAEKMDADLLMIGILPTVRESDLGLDHMSKLARYRALNEQILRLRKGDAFQLDISGREHLSTQRLDVMLEAAATSFQIHLKIPPRQSVRYFNAAIILSAPMVAISANSPYLFGLDLWDETRIPLFEQAVSVASLKAKLVDRVTFGKSYAQHSLLECFLENRDRFQVLLPELIDGPVEKLSHLRLHNGTIWRWNRPLIGFNDNGHPHLRIEHRVVPAGPSAIDTIANAAFFYGLVYMLANAEDAPEERLPFGTARANFYSAAKNSLSAQVQWLDGNTMPVYDLLLEILLPMARSGLEAQEFDRDDIDVYLDVIHGRLRERCNGTVWQRSWVAKNGNDMTALTQAYAECQRSGEPVHEWPVVKDG
jgi:gamma-glutamyl:cysteine ligase YbdK (ATP-grasp superfamily)